jgi:hypothetical protein
MLTNACYTLRMAPQEGTCGCFTIQCILAHQVPHRAPCAQQLRFMYSAACCCNLNKNIVIQVRTGYTVLQPEHWLTAQCRPIAVTGITCMLM